uniref:Uncharacterized protein n=1 Tax=Arundo donax TaxID=35708 RepID=A0A0A8YES8_ARUDO
MLLLPQGLPLLILDKPSP